VPLLYSTPPQAFATCSCALGVSPAPSSVVPPGGIELPSRGVASELKNSLSGGYCETSDQPEADASLPASSDAVKSICAV